MDDARRLYEEARRLAPAWNEPSPAVRAERRAASDALLRQAFALGLLAAGRALAQAARFTDLAESHRVGVEVARQGDVGPLCDALREPALPAELARQTVADAEAGAPWAQLALAATYVNAAGGIPLAPQLGLDPSEPLARSRRWLERAIAQGFAPAQVFLADRLREQDPAAAYAALREATRDGGLHPELRERPLVMCLELAQELGRPPAELAPQRLQLATGGHAPSMTWVGDRLRQGDGLAQDLAAARAWYERAAAGGDGGGHRELGRMYEEGLGVAVDADRARRCYEAAAEVDGDDFARGRLAARWGLAEYAALDRRAVVRPTGARAKAARPGAKKGPAAGATKTAKTTKAGAAGTAKKGAAAAKKARPPR